MNDRNKEMRKSNHYLKVGSIHLKTTYLDLCQWFSTRGNFVHEGTFRKPGDIFWLSKLGRGKCFWYAEEGASGAVKHPTAHTQPHIIKNYPAQKVSSVEVEKLWSRLTKQQRNGCRNHQARMFHQVQKCSPEISLLLLTTCMAHS